MLGEGAVSPAMISRHLQRPHERPAPREVVRKSTRRARASRIDSWIVPTRHFGLTFPTKCVRLQQSHQPPQTHRRMPMKTTMRTRPHWVLQDMSPPSPLSRTHFRILRDRIRQGTQYRRNHPVPISRRHEGLYRGPPHAPIPPSDRDRTRPITWSRHRTNPTMMPRYAPAFQLSCPAPPRPEGYQKETNHCNVPPGPRNRLSLCRCGWFRSQR